MEIQSISNHGKRSSALDAIFHAKSIALVGASDQKGSVGYALIKNLLSTSYKGAVFPVNHRRSHVKGLKAYKSVLDIGNNIDLAIIATPAQTVSNILEECGQKGIRGIVIISAGFKEIGTKGKKLYEDIEKISKKYGMRIIGPNCLGFINPTLGLNASFATNETLKGNIAFISQSGALCTAILDWSIDQRVGFSHFVSIGSMLDVSFHDLIEYFGEDENTSSILIYMESLKDPKSFLAAAKKVSSKKPIIVLKAGKSVEGAKASLSHTGSLAGNIEVFEAAFQEVGVLQVHSISQLFDCAQALAMQPIPKGQRLGIITNAGGPGILATDHLITKGGKLAKLSNSSIDVLNKNLPSHWSHGNPIDVLGDAGTDRYAVALEACNQDDQIDAIIVIMTTQAISAPSDVANFLVSRKYKKPILACWMGEGNVKEAREILEKGRIPNYRFPEEVVEVFLKMNEYAENIKLLNQQQLTDKHNRYKKNYPAQAYIQELQDKGINQLNEEEAKKLLAFYDIPVPSGKVTKTKREAVDFAKEIGFPVVMKIASHDIAHKTDMGGVALQIKTEAEVNSTYEKILSSARKHYPQAKIDGIRIEQMISKKYELLIGGKRDPIFGPIVVFGHGGVLVEYFKDTKIGMPPLNQTSALQLINNTKFVKILNGYRGMPSVNLNLLAEILVRFSYLLIDLPQISEIDINPFVIDEHGGIALDAHIVISNDIKD